MLGLIITILLAVLTGFFMVKRKETENKFNGKMMPKATQEVPSSPISDLEAEIEKDIASLKQQKEQKVKDNKEAEQRDENTRFLPPVEPTLSLMSPDIEDATIAENLNKDKIQTLTLDITKTAILKSSEPSLKNEDKETAKSAEI
jgi:hypothetical protein